MVAAVKQWGRKEQEYSAHITGINTTCIVCVCEAQIVDK